MKAKFLTILVAAIALCSACGSDEKSTDKATPKSATSAATGAIAYVDLDSVQEHYDYFIKEKAALEQLTNSMQATAQQKEQALVNLQASIQKRAQSGQITSETQYKQEVAKYQQQEEAYKSWTLQKQQEVAKEQNRVNTALQDSLDHFLAEYNKSKKFSLILNKAVILYGDKGMDITQEVIAGLNKRYNKK